MMKREREAELVFRGEQYGRAIALFQRKYGNAMPPNLDVLINEKFLRKKYKDPMTGQDFKIVTPGTPLPGQSGLREDQTGGSRGRGQGQSQSARQPGFTSATTAGTGASQALGGGPVLGVVSTSTEPSLRLFNGRDRYDEWVFTPTALTTTAGVGGVGAGGAGAGSNNSQTPGVGGANPFGNPGGGAQGGARGGAARGSQPQRPGGQQPPRPGGQQQPRSPSAPGPSSPFGGGRSPFDR
jgi:hypothetical protein